MSARRVCACGADLEAIGDALYCLSCGARARTWRVFLEGAVVAVGATPGGPGFREEAMVAFTPKFETQLRELRDGPPDPRRYAIPRSWLRGHRKRAKR